MIKYFDKKFVLAKEGEPYSKGWICDNSYVDGDVKVRYHCHITRKCRGPTHRGCNINIKLNLKIPVVFRKLKRYDSHLIMQKLGKFNCNINVITSGLQNYISFNINNKLVFIDNFQFLMV